MGIGVIGISLNLGDAGLPVVRALVRPCEIGRSF